MCDLSQPSESFFFLSLHVLHFACRVVYFGFDVAAAVSAIYPPTWNLFAVFFQDIFRVSVDIYIHACTFVLFLFHLLETTKCEDEWIWMDINLLSACVRASERVTKTYKLRHIHTSFMSSQIHAYNILWAICMHE